MPNKSAHGGRPRPRPRRTMITGEMAGEGRAWLPNWYCSGRRARPCPCPAAWVFRRHSSWTNESSSSTAAADLRRPSPRRDWTSPAWKRCSLLTCMPTTLVTSRACSCTRGASARAITAPSPRSAFTDRHGPAPLPVGDATFHRQTTICPERPAPGTADLIAHILAGYAYHLNVMPLDSHMPDAGALVRAFDIAVPAWTEDRTQVPVVVVDDESVRVTSVAVTHGRAVPALAYRFDTPDGSVVFSGDTSAMADVNDPTVVAAFKAALVHQGIIALLISSLLGFAWITVRAWLPAQAGRRGRDAISCAARAVLAAGAADRVRPAVGLRWHLAGPAENGHRAALAGHRAHRGQFAALGPARGQLGRNHLVVSPHAGRRVRRVDPGRDRSLGSWPHPAACCPGWPGWPVSAGAWWSGFSASRSAGSSPPG